ncbi:serine/threonine protein kinase [Bradymonas sediminis]|uniref:non-specific serine/threonine protein kinase n=2 Tax=Bradymonas sediminis TaxID=1548548 RepID=A0A2Z4FJK6_9DELT|nr:hypothetical protein DN745_07150 [Bradymonas sediminis]TDP64411.1 serine/threonine protein kinase [Bradymonas sediminis]
MKHEGEAAGQVETERDIKMAEIINDRFEVIRILGEGGQARATLARDLRDGKEVVVKELHLARAADWKSLELFERESSVLRNLDHPAIPSYVDGFHQEDGARVFLVQEYVSGDSLNALVEREGLFDDDKLRDFLAQMLDILAYLQRFSPPVVHRDIKPSNILRDALGKYHLVDFGAVQLIVSDEIGGSTIVGTSGFMPPEQLIGQANPASDIYALGATCVQLACGMEPGDLPMERMKLQFRDIVGLSDFLCDLLERMLEPHISARFGDAAAVITALRMGKMDPPAADPRRGASAPASSVLAHEMASLVPVRQAIGKAPVSSPKSTIYLGDDGTLSIETVSTHRVPYLLCAAAFGAGLLLVFVSMSGGPESVCCIGLPLLAWSVGFLGYRVIKSYRQYVDRLEVSPAGISLESGHRIGAAAPLLVTGQVAFSLPELRNCYLHIYQPAGRARASQQQRTGGRKRSGICFVDHGGREHAFELDGVLTRGVRRSRAQERLAAESEARWLFQVTQAHLEALTSPGAGDSAQVAPRTVPDEIGA